MAGRQKTGRHTGRHIQKEGNRHGYKKIHVGSIEEQPPSREMSSPLQEQEETEAREPPASVA
jgi:hypothetical protein